MNTRNMTAREETNIKIFTEWTNYVLQPLDITIKHLCKDLADGIILSQMCNQLAGKSPKNINLKPTTDSQKTSNIQRVLDVLRSDKCIVDVAAVDIVLGSTKQTLVLLTAMAERYQIGDRTEIFSKLGDVAAKYKLELSGNVVKSIADGKLLAGVILSCLPDSFDIQLVNNMYIEERVTYVTQLANKKLRFPELIRAEDIVFRNIEEFTVYLYLSMFLRSKSSQPNVVDQLKKTIEELSVNNEKIIQEIKQQNETEVLDLKKKHEAQVSLHTDESKKT